MGAEIPMPTPTSASLPLTQYKLLSFDVFGTLVRYKQLILTAFQPLIAQLPEDSDYRDPRPLSASVTGSATVGDIEFLKLFQKTEDAIKLELGNNPMRFDSVLQEIHRRIATSLGLPVDEDTAKHFGSVETIRSWPVFDGTIEALQMLSRRFKLVALSNVDSFATYTTFDVTKLGSIPWHKIFTAEEFGTSSEDLIKADARKFEALLRCAEDEKVPKTEILHVAQSLGHDHKPAKDFGISSVFLIGDGPVWGKEAESRTAVEKNLVGYGWRCRDLQEFALLVEQQSES